MVDLGSDGRDSVADRDSHASLIPRAYELSSALLVVNIKNIPSVCKGYPTISHNVEEQTDLASGRKDQTANTALLYLSERLACSSRSKVQYFPKT